MFRKLIAKLTRRPKLSTVAEILAPFGIDPAADHGYLIRIGRAASAVHVRTYGVKPLQVAALAPSGRRITVAGYRPADVWMIHEAALTLDGAAA